MSTYQRQIHHLGVMIHLNIIRRKRKTMAIHVYPGDQQTEVRVPLKCPWVEIDAFIDSRLDWMVDALERLADVPKPSGFSEGEVHHVLGKAYALDLRVGRRSVQISGDKLVIKCPRPALSSDVETTFYGYLKNTSLPLFEDRLNACLLKFPEAVAPSGLRVRRMKSRWGSCSERGEICLNTLLVQKEVPIIDLVINHELCHLVHFHHNKAFYELLARAMPDWQIWEERLSQDPKVSSGQGQLSLL